MTKFNAYVKELSPLVRKVNELKESLKEWKDNNEEYLEHQQYVKDAQEALKSVMECNEEASAILEEIKELSLDLKEGYAAAAKDTLFKPAEIGAYLQARAKDEGVTKVIVKGVTFTCLDEMLEGVPEPLPPAVEAL